MTDLRYKVLPTMHEYLSLPKNLQCAGECMQKILHMSYTARHEGLLALEEYGNSLDTTDEINKFVVTAIGLIIDGVDPHIVREVLENKIIVNGVTNNYAIPRFIVMEGALRIQRGENPYFIKEVMLSMIPDKFVEQLATMMEMCMDGLYTSVPEYYRRMWANANPSGKETLLVRLFRYWTEYLDDTAISNVIKETDNNQLGNVLYHSTLKTRSKFTECASKEIKLLWATSAEDYQKCHPDPDAFDVLKVVERLRDNDEISTETAYSFMYEWNRQFNLTELPTELRNTFEEWLSSESYEPLVYVSNTVDARLQGTIRDKCAAPIVFEAGADNELEDCVNREMTTHFICMVTEENFDTFPVELIYGMLKNRRIKVHVLCRRDKLANLTDDQVTAMTYYANFIGDANEIIQDMSGLIKILKRLYEE